MSDTDLYDLLGVSKTSSEAEIKKNYRKLAKELHPDKNPEAGDKFKEVSFAYEVLSDPEKRQTYDRYGLKGLQEGADSGGADDIFAHLFGGFGGMRAERNRPIREIVIKIPVTLEDFYNGNKTYPAEYRRMQICGKCEGRGGAAGCVENCRPCDGKGAVTEYQSLGMNIIRPVQRACTICSGRGIIVKEKDLCQDCKGKRIYDQPNKLDVHVDKGMSHMQKILFRSEGNQNEKGDRGDVIVILLQEEHAVFERRQNDLILRNVEISLTQALCGIEYCFKHLDGRDIIVRSKLGDVIKTGDLKGIAGEGMPQYKNPFEKGDLYIEFTVEFPKNHFATKEQMEKLESILPPRTPFVMPVGENVEEVDIVEIEPRSDSFNGNSQGGYYECDDEFGGDGANPGVQCRAS